MSNAREDCEIKQPIYNLPNPSRKKRWRHLCARQHRGSKYVPLRTCTLSTDVYCMMRACGGREEVLVGRLIGGVKKLG